MTPLVEIYQRRFPTEQVTENSGTFRAALCPACGRGTDRFRMFKNRSTDGRWRWFCNSCGAKGDVVAFVHEFCGETVPDAKRILSTLDAGHSSLSSEREAKQSIGVKVVNRDLWQAAAQAFVANCLAALNCPEAARFYQSERFLTRQTVEACGFGWNPQTVYPLRRAWGMSEAKPEQKHCLPAGAVLPVWSNDHIAALEIRCCPAHLFQGKSFTHWHLKYEAANLVLHGRGRAVALFESILDAALCWQASAFELTTIALLGGSKSFDEQTRSLIESALVVIGVPDDDQGGAKAFAKWRQEYPRIKLALPVGGKDLTDAHRAALQGDKALTAEQWYQRRVMRLIEQTDNPAPDAGASKLESEAQAMPSRTEEERACPEGGRLHGAGGSKPSSSDRPASSNVSTEGAKPVEQDCLLEWLETLLPAQPHICRRLSSKEEDCLRGFIREKLTVAPRRGDPFYHISGSELWRLEGEYERESCYIFRTPVDYLDWHIAEITGARVMDAADGQRWLLGVECAGR